MSSNRRYSSNYESYDDLSDDATSDYYSDRSNNFESPKFDQHDRSRTYSSRKYSGRVYSERVMSSRIHSRTSIQGKSEFDQIVVYLMTDRCDDVNINKLIKFFESSNFYNFHVADIPPPVSIDVPILMTQAQAIEIYRFNKILTEASNRYPDLPVLIIKDKSVTITSPELLEDVIQTGLQLSGWDMFYLNRWLDSCEQYTNKVEVEASMTTLVKTISPNSTLSIIFSPRGRDIVIGRCKMNDGTYFTPVNIPLGEKLNREIVKGNLTAICTVPNQFDFNIFESSGISDLGKLCDCKRPEVEVKNDGPGTIPFIWFVIIVLFIFFAAWALYILGTTNRRDTNRNVEVSLRETNGQ